MMSAAPADSMCPERPHRSNPSVRRNPADRSEEERTCQGWQGEEGKERDRAGPPIQRSAQCRYGRQCGAYKLASVIKVKASGKGKNRKPATNKLGSPVPVASAVYSASDDEVILAPRTKLTASKPGELIVNGTLITDTLGREIDGADDGVAGSDYVATISGTRATPGGLPMARTLEQVANVRDAVDTLLDRGELAGIARSPRARREG